SPTLFRNTECRTISRSMLKVLMNTLWRIWLTSPRRRFLSLWRTAVSPRCSNSIGPGLGSSNSSANLISGAPPHLHAEGVPGKFTFGTASSGPFGEDLPGEWLSPVTAFEYYLTEVRPWGQPLTNGWWDIHARIVDLLVVCQASFREVHQALPQND